MSNSDAATMLVIAAGVTLELAILAGLIIRRRLGEFVALPLLLVATIGSAATIGLCPACNTWDFWIAKEFVHLALALLLGLELAQRAFTTAVAQSAARRWVAFATALTLVAMASTRHELITVDTLPVLTASVAWLYTGLAAVMLWHTGGRCGEPLHDVLLWGFPPYLMLYATSWSQAASTPTAAATNAFVWLLLLVALLRAAWQQPSTPGAPAVPDVAQARGLR